MSSVTDHKADVDMIGALPSVPTILEVVCRTTGMGFAAVARVTSERWIACNVKDDIAFGLVPGGELEVETTICHEIRQTGEAVIVNHVAEDPCFAGHHTPLQYGFQSYISMPIVLPNGEFFGTLCAIDPAPHKLDNPETVAMFRLFADLIAMHIDAHQRAELSEGALLDERKTAELREQFIAVLGHDLRNPLASIDAGTKLLLRHGALTAKAHSIVVAMQSSADRMAALIENVLDFARGRLGGGLSLNRSDEAMAPILNQVIDELRSSWADCPIETDFAIDRPVNCDRVKIAQLFSNLLGNALTHGAKTAPVVVRAATEGDLFTLSVTNPGKDIPPDALARLFQPFARGGNVTNAQGLGLGLYIASEIARGHGGTLTAASAGGTTTFTFTMPLAG